MDTHTQTQTHEQMDYHLSAETMAQNTVSRDFQNYPLPEFSHSKYLKNHNWFPEMP